MDSLSQPDHQHLSMLLVEDEEPCRRALQKVLQSCGHTVRAVASAEEAIELLSLNHTHIALMIADVDLPGMCGLDLIRNVQASNPAIRLLLVTAADRGMVQRFCTKHSVEYYPKPLDVRGFLDAIKSQQHSSTGLLAHHQLEGAT